MDGEVIIGIPVSPETAELLRDGNRARAAGLVLSRIVRPTSTDTDPLADLIGDIKAEARAGGLTDREIDDELAAYNAERRI